MLCALMIYTYICLETQRMRMKQYLMGYDIGSSSVKASLVEPAGGRCVASAFYPKTEAPILAVQAGWAEQEPESWWQ